jgi:hypothetical protein
MGNQHHSDLENLKEKAIWSKQAKRMATESSSVAPLDSILLVMSRDEYNLVLEQMYKILESNESMSKKKIALSLMKHMEADDN